MVARVALGLAVRMHDGLEQVVLQPLLDGELLVGDLAGVLLLVGVLQRTVPPSVRLLDLEPGVVTRARRGLRVREVELHALYGAVLLPVGRVSPRCLGVVANGAAVGPVRLLSVALAAIHTRQSNLPGFREALNLCKPILTAARCVVSRQVFTMPGGSSRGSSCNLVGYRRGTASEPRLFVIGAHLDSVNHEDGDGSRAPGADDNATGSVTVMQVATALARAPELAHDVAFLLFGGEEQGLLGSLYFVNNLSPKDRARIAGVVNIDMAGSMNTPAPSVLPRRCAALAGSDRSTRQRRRHLHQPRDASLAQPLCERPCALPQRGHPGSADDRGCR